ncbi:hypothetical protein PoB_000774900 [Plakobranchus ocellatus]|uniref:Uncharacterized protein n=1 Tax=Plakobranchus ocellatus TaxID=259542 RepID=A0AAV3YG12_9GAST|nr:hypothetical protein PoB_000774900 [Plakobranchus ocellatus]
MALPVNGSNSPVLNHLLDVCATTPSPHLFSSVVVGPSQAMLPEVRLGPLMLQGEARAPVAGLEPATEGYLQISGQALSSLCHQCLHMRMDRAEQCQSRRERWKTETDGGM